MKTPRTRLDEATTELERDLLRSWATEGPSRAARRRAFGIAVGTAGAAAAGTAAGATGGALAPKVTAALGLAVGKWLAAGALVVTGALVARPHLRTSSKALPAVVAASRAAERARAAVPTLAPAAPGASAPAVEEPSPSIAAPAPRRASRVRRGEAVAPTEGSSWRVDGPSAASASGGVAPTVAPPVEVAPPPAPVEADAPAPARQLGEQVASLDRAERALAAGDAALALRLVDDYEQRFPAGSLLQEATVVRVDALLKLGRRDAAGEVGRAFLSAHPTSPYALKLRRRLEAGSIP